MTRGAPLVSVERGGLVPTRWDVLAVVLVLGLPQQGRLHVTEDAGESRIVSRSCTGQRDPERPSDH